MSIRMGKSLKSGLTARKPLKRGPLAKQGRLAQEWTAFRNAEFEKDKDEEGLIRCQDTEIGLPHCGVSRVKMDLHHTEGREGKLLFDKSKMVWLTRECHRKAHEQKNSNTGRPGKVERA